MRELTLYIRVGCHLCDEMQRDLLVWGERLGFRFGVVDIDADESLIERYQYKVPVLVDGCEEICHFFLDEDMLQQHFQSQ